ncbi:MAG: hypothetical protein J2P28_03530 [Actinobacteria bacterium]|nr:hypothetical protein [Actinomycetota bacterium]MBO0834577.1 hypothetical protein [Actinomycetota bacterium]
MSTVPQRAKRAVIAGAATAVAVTLAAPAASALAATHGKSGSHVPAAKPAHPHKSNLKVTG